MAHHHRLLAAAVLLAAPLMYCDLAYAQATTGADDKIWTGNACVPAAGNSWFTTKIRPTHIQNVQNAPRYITCTVEVDADQVWNTADNNGGTDNGSASVFLDFDYSEASSATTTCTVQLINSATNTIVETSTQSVAGVGGDATVGLSFFSLLQGSADNVALGFNCLLPPLVKLTTINIEEYAATHQNTVYP